MTLKLSEVFIPLPGKSKYSAAELYALKLQPDFIKKMAAHFGLTYIEDTGVEGNLCFAENKEVRPEYKTTFSKTDVLRIVSRQLPGQTANLEQDEVIFPEDAPSFFQEA